MKTIRLNVENKRTTTMSVVIEPEAMDFWLSPNEEVQLVATGDSDAHFEIQQTNEGLIVFPSRSCGSISVFQGVAELACGYQRPRGQT
jgi:hypothetical protein